MNFGVRRLGGVLVATPSIHDSRITIHELMAKVARKFLIRGDVQRVGFRFFAQRAAARHQVLGYVRNCPDGTVEALVEGPAVNVDEFRNDLVTGPQWSRVEHVEEISLEPTGLYSSFRIER
jgi:acylphosphatase